MCCCLYAVVGAHDALEVCARLPFVDGLCVGGLVR